MLHRLGSSGFIGGDALFTIANAHPEYELTALVRNSDRGALVASQYPKIRLVYGDLESADLIREEAQKADIVLSEYRHHHRAGRLTADEDYQILPMPTTRQEQLL